MDTAQWPQGIGVDKPIEGSILRSQPMLERRSSSARPQTDLALNCPRCNSTNTKFCYYNNYSLSQPRYFCKTCRRYWTEGGSLRNVPVGGASRKNKRSSSTSRKLINSNIVDHDHGLTPPASFSHSASQNPKIHEGQDLNLAYPPPVSSADHHHHHHHQDQDYNNLSSKFVEAPPYKNLHHQIQNPNSNSSVATTSRGLNLMSSFMQMPIITGSNTTMYSTSGFPFQELKPTLNFSLDGFDDHQTGYGSTSLQSGVLQENGNTARLLFPVEDIKSVPTSTEFEQNRGRGDYSGGYWSGMLGGGSW